MQVREMSTLTMTSTGKFFQRGSLSQAAHSDGGFDRPAQRKRVDSLCEKSPQMLQHDLFSENIHHRRIRHLMNMQTHSPSGTLLPRIPETIIPTQTASQRLHLLRRFVSQQKMTLFSSPALTALQCQENIFQETLCSFQGQIFQLDDSVAAECSAFSSVIP